MMTKDELTVPSGVPEGFVLTQEGGLSPEEAAARLERGLGNKSNADPGKSVWQILAGNLFTLFNLLNVALALCLALVGSYRNMLFLGVVISNTAIGTFQELRAHRTIRRLKLMNAPLVRLLRGGRECECEAEQAVQGDLAIFRAGDQIPADAIVRSGSGMANEALLTGESDGVTKREGDWLLSGSYVTEGRLVAQLVYVGDESYVSRLTRHAKRIRRPKSALMNDLSKLIRLVSVLLLPIGLLLFGKQVLLQGAPLASAVPSSVAAMLGMIPEGLMLLTSVALFVGVVRLGRHQTLVQELYGIETLARADVLCLDKTGTLTTGDMRLKQLIPLGADEESMRRAISRFLSAFDLSSGTLNALRAVIVPSGEEPVATVPFSSARKLSAAGFADGETLILGAPSFVLGGAWQGDARDMAERAAAEGCRVLALCRAQGLPQGERLPTRRELLGLILLEDTLRPHCEDTLRYFEKQGVTLKVISGDDPRTVSAVARRAGLPAADSWVDASTLQTVEQLRLAATRYTVFGRVTPEQKRLLVEALKAAGHSVAMTGDGVNDIPALKAADCSIAIAGGAEAARQAAQLTLLDADFSRMPLVVDEGRRVINNITRAASLFLVKTLYSFALALLMLVLPAAYPFQPIQLTLVSTLTIGIPSFVLALEPNRERVQGSFLRTVISRAVPGATAVAVLAALCMLLVNLGYAPEVCSTMATLATGAVGLTVLLLVCMPFNRLRAALFAAMATLLLLAAALLGRLFFLVPLSAPELALLAGLMLAGVAMVIGLTRLVRARRPASQTARG